MLFGLQRYGIPNIAFSLGPRPSKTLKSTGASGTRLGRRNSRRQNSGYALLARSTGAPSTLCRAEQTRISQRAGWVFREPLVRAPRLGHATGAIRFSICPHSPRITRVVWCGVERYCATRIGWAFADSPPHTPPGPGQRTTVKPPLGPVSELKLFFGFLL